MNVIADASSIATINPPHPVDPHGEGKDSQFHYPGPAETHVDERRVFGSSLRDENVSSRSISKKQAAIDIQRLFRGFVGRRTCRGMQIQVLSGRAIRAASENLVAWHLGWTRLLTHIVVFVVYIAASSVQVFKCEPMGLDTNQAARKRALMFNPDVVFKPENVMTFADTIVDGLYSGSNISAYSDACLGAYRVYCDSVETDSVAYQNIVKSCPPRLTDDIGFIDVSSRILDLVIVQTRRKAKKCVEEVVQRDPFRSNTLNCSDKFQEDSTYETDACFQAGNCSNLAEKDQDAYSYNPTFEGFTTMFSLGATNIPIEAIKCRMSRYKDWLDYRTKNVLVIYANLNSEGVSGRFTVTTEKFEFLLGGNVLRTRTIKSTPLYPNGGSAVGITLAVMVLASARFLYDLFSWSGTRGFSTLICHRMAHFLSILSILAACSCYLYWFDKASTLVVPAINTTEAAVVGRFAQSISTINSITDVWVSLKTLTVVALLLLLNQTFILLSFHSRTAVVSRIVLQSLHDLGAFFFIFSIVVSTYAYGGVIFFGAETSEFGSFWTALNRLLLLAIGELQDGTFMMFPNYDDKSINAVLSGIFFWSYIALVTIILMSVLLSIIVRSFLEISNGVEERARTMLSLTQTFALWFEFESNYFGRGLRIFGNRLCKRWVNRPDSPSKWDTLLAIRQKYSAAGTSPQEYRVALSKVFSWNTVVAEKVLHFVRRETRSDGWRLQSYLLRGNEPVSEEVAARQMLMIDGLHRKADRLASSRTRELQAIRPVSFTGNLDSTTSVNELKKRKWDDMQEEIRNAHVVVEEAEGQPQVRAAVPTKTMTKGPD